MRLTNYDNITLRNCGKVEVLSEALPLCVCVRVCRRKIVFRNFKNKTKVALLLS